MVGRLASGRVVLGTAQWGSSYGINNLTGQTSPAEADRMLSVGRRAGICEIDTARAYGASERLVGSIAGDGCWEVMTKLSPAIWEPGLSVGDAIDRSAKSLAESTRALGRIRISGVLLHRSNQVRAAGGELWPAVRGLVADHGIPRVGVSITQIADAWSTLDAPGVDAIQVPGSLLDQRLLRTGLLDQFRSRGIDVYVRSVFLQGAIFMEGTRLPDSLAPLRPVLGALRSWGDARGWDLHRLFLTFARDAFDAKVVVGCESVAQLEQHLAVWSAPILSQGDLAELRELVPELPDSVLNPARWD